MKSFIRQGNIMGENFFFFNCFTYFLARQCRVLLTSLLLRERSVNMSIQKGTMTYHLIILTLRETIIQKEKLLTLNCKRTDYDRLREVQVSESAGSIRYNGRNQLERLYISLLLFNKAAKESTPTIRDNRTCEGSSYTCNQKRINKQGTLVT